ncbi:hypothetical protein KKC32_01075 [Patescibacteria group bacterium]|nr:hypothetical protein [Patescibacteria group bacterium]
MKFKKFLIIGCIIFGCSLACSVHAGFGVSPSDVNNYNLLPESSFEKVLYLNRSDAEQSLFISMTVDDGLVRDWITSDRADHFVMPAGAISFPVTIKVNVPVDAEMGNYRGTIKFVANTGDPANPGSAQAVLGAIAKYNLKVTNTNITDYRVESMNLLRIEKGEPLSLSLRIRNLGNTAVAPTRVHIDIMSIADAENILESHDITQFDESVPAFMKTEIMMHTAENINLEPKSYRAEVTVYQDEKKLRKEKMILEIFEVGSLRQGILTGMELKNNLMEIDKPVSLTAEFKNTGHESLDSKLLLDIYDKNNRLVGKFQSEPVKTQPTQTAVYDVSLMPRKSGEYIIKGVVEYDGKVSEGKEINASGFYSTRSLVVVISLGIVNLLLLIGLMFVSKKVFAKRF